ncbi:MAG: 3-oxoacyl-[acyl-carrier protein] reductase [Actinomycetota bacterium]|nr:3-oxoacyl-[acyl-carrier protein] reductase [Actinomycetota bacterium]
MDLGLSDRVYVVTRAAGGVGRACAEQLVGEGARLVLTAPQSEELKATAAHLGGPERAIALPGDISDPGLETCLVAAAVARYGRIDGALITMEDLDDGTTMNVDDGTWRLSFESAFLGPLRLCRAIGTHASLEGASIAIVLSPSVHEPIPGRALANGLAPALAMTAKSLADELGPRNIRINSVLPGSPRQNAASSDGSDQFESQEREVLAPLRRRGELLELARPAVFLLSPAASYVTGSALVVDGGSARRL